VESLRMLAPEKKEARRWWEIHYILQEYYKSHRSNNSRHAGLRVWESWHRRKRRREGGRDVYIYYTITYTMCYGWCYNNNTRYFTNLVSDSHLSITWAMSRYNPSHVTEKVGNPHDVTRDMSHFITVHVIWTMSQYHTRCFWCPKGVRLRCTWHHAMRHVIPIISVMLRRWLGVDPH